MFLDTHYQLMKKNSEVPKGRNKWLLVNFIFNTSFSSKARARRASLASKESRTDTSSSLAFSAYDFKRFNLPGFSPRTGSPSTRVSFDSAASNSAFAVAASPSANARLFLREDISFLRSEIRLYVLLTAFLRICNEEKSVSATH